MAGIISGVEYSELPGSPTEKYTDTGFQAVQRFKCPWSQRHKMSQQLKRGRGMTYHYNVVARVSDVAIAPFFDEEGKASPSVRLANYSDAVLTVTYRTPDNHNVIDSDDDEKTLVSESIEPWTEFITLPGRRLYWDAAHTKPLGDDVNPGMLVRGVNWVYTIYQVNTLLPAYFSLIGKVNSTLLNSKTLNVDFKPGTLLFNPPSFNRVITSDGIKAWTVNLAMAYREFGWNQFYNIKDEAFASVYVTGKNTTAEIYKSADFKAELGVGN